MNLESISSSFFSNRVDLILGTVFLIYLINGIRKGFLPELIDLAGFLLSFLSSLRYYGVLAAVLVNYFSVSRGIANALGFLLAGFLVELLFSIFVRLIFKRIPDYLVTSRWSRILGIIPSLLNGLILVAFILTLFITLPVRGNIKAAILSSRIGGPIVSKTQGIEGKLKTIFGGAINETLTFLTVEPKGTESVNLQFKANQTDLKTDEKAEERMLLLVNAERTGRGLLALVADPDLVAAAREHSTDMFLRGYFSHNTPEGVTPFDRMTKDGVSFLAAGENIAYAPNVDLAHTGLMNSPGHRANILSTDFSRIGIGIVDGGIYGEMFTQDFAN